MSQVDDFMRKCQAHGPATLDDHLWREGYTTFAENRRMRAAAGRALRDGGGWRHLAVNGVVRPSAGARKESAWSAGLPKAANMAEIDLRSGKLVPVGAAMGAMQHLSPETRAVVAATHNLPIEGKNGEAVAASQLALMHDLEMSETRRLFAEDKVKTQEKIIADKRASEEFLREMLRRYAPPGGSGVAAAE